MQNVTWVINFNDRPSVAVAARGSFEALEVVERQRRHSRQMFATTRALLAEARAVLAAAPVAESRRSGRRAKRREMALVDTK